MFEHERKLVCARTILGVIMTMGIGLAGTASAQVPSGTTAEMSNPNWDITLDSGGYSDFWWFNPTPGHPFPRHELISGEWAAAIYYEGVANSGMDPTALAPSSTWLTDSMIFPDWTTNSAFLEVLPIATWDNAANPVVGFDTGRSIITNGQVTIQIDYEMVDLDPLNVGAGRSPMGTIADPATGAFRDSDRYVMLQTYTIANMTAQEIDVEFYQMLQGHPADEMAAAVDSVYDSDDYGDVLAVYVPFDPIHTTGNFRYDITQWNDVMAAEATADHIDWVGFSSTVEPDVFENGVFTGHGLGKPPLPGTHWNIEDRALNGLTSSFGEVAGAEGWYLGLLAPGELVSHTVVLMPSGIPEPATLLVMAAGAGALFRRRTHRHF